MSEEGLFFVAGTLFGLFYFFSTLFIDFLTVKVLEINKRKIYIPFDETGIETVPVWVKSKDYKKIEEFYKRKD